MIKRWIPVEDYKGYMSLCCERSIYVGRGNIWKEEPWMFFEIRNGCCLCYSGYLNLWNYKTGERILSYSSSPMIKQIVMLYDDLFATVTYRSEIEIWSLLFPTPRSVLKSSSNFTSLCAITGGTILVSQSADGEFKFWDIATGQCSKSFESGTGAKFGFELLSFGDSIIASLDCSSGLLKFWSISEEKIIGERNGLKMEKVNSSVVGLFEKENPTEIVYLDVNSLLTSKIVEYKHKLECEYVSSVMEIAPEVIAVRMSQGFHDSDYSFAIHSFRDRLLYFFCSQQQSFNIHLYFAAWWIAVAVCLV